MAENYLSKFLKPRYISIGALVDNRFVVIRREATWIDRVTYVAKDTMYDELCLLHSIGKAVDNGQRMKAHLDFLALCRGIAGFPKLVKSFPLDDDSAQVIVTSPHGETLQHKLLKTAGFVSYENGLRLFYQMMVLLEKVHNIGFVHRDVTPNSIRIDLGWDGNVSLEIHTFDYIAPANPAPICKGMEKWNFQSPQVADGQPYNIVDDMISSLFVAMNSQAANSLWERLSSDLTVIERKKKFHDDPIDFFDDKNLEWMGRLYIELVRQRVQGFDRDGIMKILDNAIPNVDPKSPLTWAFVSTSSADFKLLQNREKSGEPSVPNAMHKVVVVPNSYRD